LGWGEIHWRARELLLLVLFLLFILFILFILFLLFLFRDRQRARKRGVRIIDPADGGVV
jgi:hypothetical protein